MQNDDDESDEQRDHRTWERVAQRWREDCEAKNQNNVENELKEMLQNYQNFLDTMDDTNNNHNHNNDPPSNQVEFLLNHFYKIASHKSVKPQERRKALTTILELRKKLGAYVNANANINNEASATTTVTSMAKATSKLALTTSAARDMTTTTATPPTEPPALPLNKDATTTPASIDPRKIPPAAVMETTLDNKRKRSTSTTTTGTSTSSQPQHRSSITASLAAAAVSTAEAAASSVADSSSIYRATASAAWQKKPPPLPNGGAPPPPYQRTSDTVAQNKAQNDDRRANRNVSAQVPSTATNGTRLSQQRVQEVAATNTLVPDNSAMNNRRRDRTVEEPEALVPPARSPVSSITAAPPPAAATTPTAAATTTTITTDTTEQDMDISDGDDPDVTSPNRSRYSLSPNGATQTPPVTTKKMLAPASDLALGSDTIIGKGQSSVHFPADEKSRGFGTTYYSCAQKERKAVRVVYQRHSPSEGMLIRAGRLFDMWEPYWQVVKVVATGVTSKIDKVECEDRNKKLIMKPMTAGFIDFPRLAGGGLYSKIQWGKNTLDPNRKPKDGDYALLLRMLPLHIDPKYKNKRANCHLWPKGTFLMVNGTPVVLQQRKQASHDSTKWEYLSHPLDLAQHIKSTTEKTSVAMCCYDSTPFLFMVAVCCYKSPSTFTKGMMQHDHSFLQRLSLEESYEKAMEYIQQHSISFDDDDGDDNGQQADKLVFSLMDPISKLPMKIPVRGQWCKHWQCFDLETFMLVNCPVSGGRWRCACCELYVSHSEIQLCGLTQQALATYGSKVSATRNRVEFCADKNITLLEPQQSRKANNKRAVENKKQEPAQLVVVPDRNASAPTPPPAAKPPQTVIEIIDSDSD